VRWFLTYAWRHPGETTWHYENEIIRVHPLRWFAALLKEAQEDYRIVFYDRIGPQEPYVEYLIDYALEENAGEVAPLPEGREPA